MKLVVTVLGIVCPLLASCSTVSRGEGGSYNRTSVGRDTGMEIIIEDNPGGGGHMYLAMDSNESRSFLSVMESVRAYFYMDALKSITERGFDSMDTDTKSETIIKSREVDADAATEALRIEAATPIPVE